LIVFYLTEEFDESVSYNDPSIYSFKVDGKIVDASLAWINHYHYGVNGITGLGFVLSKPLPEGSVQLIIDTEEFMTLAMDPFPEQLVSDPDLAVVVPKVGAPVAAEFKQDDIGHNDQIILTYDESVWFNYNNYVGGFVLKIDEVEHELRGFYLSSYEAPNQLIFNLWRDSERELREALRDATSIEIKYVKKNGDSFMQVSDLFNNLAENFDYISVTK
jgi:hypothetical protein